MINHALIVQNLIGSIVDRIEDNFSLLIRIDDRIGINFLYVIGSWIGSVEVLVIDDRIDGQKPMIKNTDFIITSYSKYKKRAVSHFVLYNLVLQVLIAI